ncbi:MAG: hypothetical protein ABS75_21125 [Pelagibacterium sp. SCN 63-23]|nr:MAG: hypothetical protein ABS75_21125 [Pelagibacterium sp. SCN 63-23]
MLSPNGRKHRSVILVLCAIGATFVMGSVSASDDSTLGLTPTGRGPFDLYMRVVQCHAVLKDVSSNEDGGRAADRIAQGLHYTVRFAQFLLDENTVVGPDGTLRQLKDLLNDLLDADDRWNATLQTAAAPTQSTDLATEHCLVLFGHDWE